MTNQRIRLTIPLVIVAGSLFHCWATIFSTDIIATWQHYVGLVLFIILILLYFISLKLAIIGTGIYLFLGSMAWLAITATIKMDWIDTSHGPVTQKARVHLLSAGLLMLWLFLNFGSLMDIYVEEERNRQKNKLD